MQGPPGALRFVLAHGVPTTLEVIGRSMEPSLAKGVKVTVEPVAADAALRVGDLVVVTTDEPDVLLLHRLMHLFSERGQPFIIHQGDAPSSTFGICPRDNVVARVKALAGSDAALPTLDRLSASDRARFSRRRLACAGIANARRLLSALGVADNLLVRRCGSLYRSIARRLVG